MRTRVTHRYLFVVTRVEIPDATMGEIYRNESGAEGSLNSAESAAVHVTRTR